MNVYFISGLGADKQMFSKTVLPDGYNGFHLEWIKPEAGEDFLTYARRLSEGIDVLQPFVLIGLSLGGMMAVEMNKFLSPSYTLLISSVTNSSQLPFWFKLAGITHIYKIIPNSFFHHCNAIASWLLGAQSKDDKLLLGRVMRNADPFFVKWAIPRILKWDNQFIPNNMHHIHGTADIILPYRSGAGTIPVEKGTHFMVYNRATQINKIIAYLLLRLKH